MVSLNPNERRDLKMNQTHTELVQNALQSGPLTISQIYDRLNGKGWPDRTDGKIRDILKKNADLFELTGKRGAWRGAKWQNKKATTVKADPQNVQTCECECAGCRENTWHCHKKSRGCNW